MRTARRIGLLSVLVAVVLPAANAGAATRTYPGCGATLADCIASAPGGTTIRLRTNALIPIPDDLLVKKGLNFVAARGFHPAIGRTGSATDLNFELKGSADVAITGIRFRQVGISIEVTAGSGHRVAITGSRFRIDRESNGGSAISVFYGSGSRGSVSIRDNDISASGLGMEIGVRGGPVTITGNRVTAPVIGDSQGGFHVQAGGGGTVRGTIASNLVHGVSGCGCGNPAAVAVYARDTATFDVRILNNTIAGNGMDPGSQAYGIALTSGSSQPDSHMTVALYNNLVADTFDKGIWSWEERIAITADANNTFGSAQGDLFGAGDVVGTLLHLDPQFRNAGAGDYRLAAGSPLANKGRTCIARLPLPRGDAAGRFRLAGSSVDIGAYERGSSIKGGVKGVNRSGSNGANKLSGTAGSDILCGNGGNDRLFGRSGDDFLFGGPGRDKAYGGPGRDRVNVKDGVAGNDRADGGRGRDVCTTDANDRRISC